ncbi:berberine bridge enzyme-like 21 [Heracleum sosnowskyi]|uniref:Berberine bridge enzyme-like 21 n=1 Tax=Heracleum sosnowskyi TaxID=360622 RepID=A0AAD8HKU5_9APIA|nr:berberine bridge enzyme-like 21 [Heracleum sosnowskyi]
MAQLSFFNLSAMFLQILLLFSLICLTNASIDQDYTTFVQCLVNKSSPSDQNTVSSVVYTPQNTSFATVLQAYIKNKRFNTSTTPKPIIIITATKYSHVQSTVICAKNMGIQLKIRSGGHDYDGISYVCDQKFIVLDMNNLRKIDVDIGSETAVVEAGAILGELYHKIWEKSNVYAFPAGVCLTVGVGGHLSGGGYGNMLRKFGLSVDHVFDAKIVDVKGRILDRRSMGEDLFWAIRGGGGASFGVVLSYTIKLVKVPRVTTVFNVSRTLEENATDIVHRYQHVVDKLDDGLFIRTVLQPVDGKVNGTKTVRATFIGMFLGGSSRLMRVMDKGFPELGLNKVDCLEMSWIRSVVWWAYNDDHSSVKALLLRSSDGVNFLKRKSDYVQTPIPKDGLESMWRKLIELGKVGYVFNPYGGKMSEISSSATPFPHREGNIYKIQYTANWHEQGQEADRMYMSQIRSLYSFMTPFVSNNPRGSYLNYRDLDIGVSHHGKKSYEEGKVYGLKYFGENFERLVKVKTAVDPDNFFRNEQSIPVKMQARRGNSEWVGESDIPDGPGRFRNEQIIPGMPRYLVKLRLSELNYLKPSTSRVHQQRGKFIVTVLFLTITCPIPRDGQEKIQR